MPIAVAMTVEQIMGVSQMHLVFGLLVVAGSTGAIPAGRILVRTQRRIVALAFEPLAANSAAEDIHRASGSVARARGSGRCDLRFRLARRTGGDG